MSVKNTGVDAALSDHFRGGVSDYKSEVRYTYTREQLRDMAIGFSKMYAHELESHYKVLGMMISFVDHITYKK